MRCAAASATCRPKFGCGQGTCGACTVLIDGEPQLACLTLAETCAGRVIETALGLADGPNLHPLQAAFMEHFAAQCGFCTLGHADGGQGAARPQSRRRRARTWPRPSPATSAAAPATSRSSTPSWMPRPSAAGSQTGSRAVLEFRKEYFKDERDDRLNEVGQPHPAPGHAGPRHRPLALLRRPCLRGPAAPEGAAQPASARAPALHRRVGGRARARRQARDPRRRRAGEQEHAAEPHRLRQGRRAAAGGRQGALQGRADRRRRGRERSGGLCARSPRSASTTTRCPRCSTSRRRSSPAPRW